MKLAFLPEKEGYAYDEGPFRSVLGTIPSPAPEVGKGQPNTFYVVKCSFIFERAEFDQFMAFFQQHETGITFEADLITAGAVLEEHKCKFEQESLRITNKGIVYYVSVTINALKV